MKEERYEWYKTKHKLWFDKSSKKWYIVEKQMTIDCRMVWVKVSKTFCSRLEAIDELDKYYIDNTDKIV